MRDFVARFLILALISLNSYAGPLDLGLDNRNRPDMRPGERGSIAQEAMGSSQNQYSILNPGSNQSVFVRNTFLLPQQNGNNFNSNGYVIFNPQSVLSGEGYFAPLDAMAKHLLESNGDNSLTNRVASAPFGSKVAKSQTQGMAFVRTGNSFANNKNASSAVSYPAGADATIADLAKFEAHKSDPSHVPIGTPIAMMFIAAALLFLPSIINMVANTIPNSTNEALGLDLKSSTSEISTKLKVDGVPPKDAEIISQVLIMIWMIALSAGTGDVPADARNEIAGYFQESCATCTPQMIDAVMTKSEKLVSNNPALRLNKSQLNEIAAKINLAMKSLDQGSQNVSGGESGKQIFIKRLQGKILTLGTS